LKKLKLQRHADEVGEGSSAHFSHRVAAMNLYIGAARDRELARDEIAKRLQ
jgi:hypothetical protein